LNYDPPLSTSHVTLSISAKLQDAADVAGPWIMWLVMEEVMGMVGEHSFRKLS
jgi:hypothetical protein